MIFARRPRKEQAKPTALEVIESAETHLLTALWKGLPCVVKVRTLSDIQIQSLGNFSLIETEEYKWSKAPGKTTTWGERLSYLDMAVKVCRAALISPTYDEIFGVIGKTSFNAEVKACIEHINKMLASMLEGPAKQELEEKRDSLIAAWDVILPADFMNAVVADALAVDKTDIKKVTEDMLYGAAILAERGHKAPHEYICPGGVFSPFNVRDIDLQAWIIYDRRVSESREQARQKREN
jgi:hypothetical protein